MCVYIHFWQRAHTILCFTVQCGNVSTWTWSWVMESYLGHLWSQNEKEWIFLLRFCEKRRSPSVQQNATHFTLNLKLRHMQSFFLKAIYGKQLKRGGKSSCLKKQHNATPQTVTPNHTPGQSPQSVGEEERNVQTHPTSDGKFVLLPNTQLFDLSL